MTNSQITLLIYVVVLLPLMLLGFYFARRKMFNQHKLTMTTIFIANWVLIAWVMSPSYRDAVSAPNADFSSIFLLLPTIHMGLGALAQLVATYLVILMWTERTPLEKLVPFRIKNIKTPMRITLSIWIITILLGLGIYATWYGFDNFFSPAPAESTEEAPAPESTEDAEEVDESPAPESTEDAEEAEEPATTEEP